MGQLHIDIDRVVKEFAPGERFTASDVAVKLNRKNGVGISDILSSFVHTGVLSRRSNGTYERKQFSLQEVKNFLVGLSVEGFSADGLSLYIKLANDMTITLDLSYSQVRELHDLTGQQLVTDVAEALRFDDLR